MPRVTVADTSTEIARGFGRGRIVTVRNPGGGSTVDLAVDGTPVSGSDFELQGGESWSVTLDSGSVLYGIVSSGTQAVQVIAAQVS